MAKHRTRHLFKRGKNFYVGWVVEGKVFSKALRDDAGKPFTARREDGEERTKLMAPFIAADEITVLESIVGRLDGRKAEIAKFEREQNPPLLISQAWTAFPGSPNARTAGPETLYQYEY